MRVLVSILAVIAGLQQSATQGIEERKKTTAFALDMASDIRSHYILGYYPATKSDGARPSASAVKVRTVSSDYEVHVSSE